MGAERGGGCVGGCLMSKGGACQFNFPRGVLHVNVQGVRLSICWGGGADDVAQAMSKGGGGVLVNVFTPPSVNPVSAPGMVPADN